MANESTHPAPKPLTLEFFLTDGSLAQAGTSFVLVPRHPVGKPLRRRRRLGSLTFSA